MNRPDPDAAFDAVMPPVLSSLAREIDVLEAVASVIRAAQALTPRPTFTEIHQMRSGDPLTRAAYLIGRLQRALLLIETAASGLQSDLDQGIEDCWSLDLAEVDFEAIEAALARLVPPFPPI